MTDFVLVSCSKSKQDGIHTAADLYEPSTIFRKRQRFARIQGDAWGILSAKYGYVRPWEGIENYERHISDRTPAWGALTLRDLVDDLRYYEVDTVTILAGSQYVKPLVVGLENRGYDVVDYNRGLRPGERMQALDDAVKPGRQETLTSTLDD